jgi:hypothetical protein
VKTSTAEKECVMMRFNDLSIRTYMELGADYFFKKGTESEKVEKVIEKLIREWETHA